jgi:hypothetical protein
LYEYTGTNAGTTASSDRFATTFRFRANDEGSGTNTSSNPLVKTGSTVYSYERHLRMLVTGGSGYSLTNPKVYTDGTAWDSGNVVAYMKDSLSSTGATPAQASSTTGFTNSTTYVTGSRKSLGTYTVTTAVALGDFLICFCTINGSASTGTVGNRTWTWAYDEA